GTGQDGGGEQPGQLSAEEQAEVKQLKATDRRVRAHEMAHIAAGAGVVTSGARFEYEKGPDGQLYAVGGEVSIDSSPVRGDPEATIVKAGKVRRAALAPSDPSAQDRRVAAQAAQMAAQARLELARSQGRENEQAGQSAGLSERNVAPFAEAAPAVGGSVDRIA
ncbi:MAG TPA: putative metalloprotease CJM1_0395 family protein, partial [Candidatus Aminicenantes bacterium]|nr:putative metalloprotease CJM1_0395 family protein [Candidatus Aminicenantes bacterium]